MPYCSSLLSSATQISRTLAGNDFCRSIFNWGSTESGNQHSFKSGQSRDWGDLRMAESKVCYHIVLWITVHQAIRSFKKNQFASHLDQIPVTMYSSHITELFRCVKMMILYVGLINMSVNKSTGPNSCKQQQGRVGGVTLTTSTVPMTLTITRHAVPISI